MRYARFGLSVFFEVCLLLAFAPPLFAAPHITDFNLGISREEMRLRAAEPCGENLCGQVAFGGQEWNGTFLMQDERLAAITLVGPPQSAYMDAALEGFKDSPYIVYRVISEKACFDFIQETRRGVPPAGQEAAFAQFLQNLRAPGNTFASYFYTDRAVFETLKSQAALEATKVGLAADSPQQDEFATKKGMPSADCLPSAYPAKLADVEQGVACCLTVDEGDITIIIMAWGDMQAKLADKAREREAVLPELKLQ